PSVPSTSGRTDGPQAPPAGSEGAVSHPVIEERPVAHGDAMNVVRQAIAEAPGPEAAAQRAVEELHERFPHYDWFGIYWVDIDATDPAAFDETDRIFLEEIAALLAPLRPRP